MQTNKKYIVGIDESAKCPVIGCMVLSMAYILEDDIDKLNNIGLKDSKDMSSKQIKDFYIKNEYENICEVKTVSILPKEIDNKDKFNFNELEMFYFMNLLIQFKNNQISKLYVDNWERNKKAFWKRYESIREKTCISIPKIQESIIEHGADEKYPIVQAASVYSKYNADLQMKELDRWYGVGSGHQGSKKTDLFLANNIDKVDEYPFIRKSYSTIDRIRKNKKDIINKYKE